MNILKLSIIVPVYNAEAYLEQCLTTLVNQTLREIEIICVNDGSTDNSLSILKTFAEKDPRIVLVNKENSGQAEARNIGIKHAKGEFLGFVDADDWVDLDFFEKLYNAAKRYDCDIACAGFKRCKNLKKSVKKSFNDYKVYTDINSKVKIDNLPEHNYVWNKIYNRKNWLNTGIFFPKGRCYEDVAILIQILNQLKDMVTVPNIYYYYRKNPNSTIECKYKNGDDLVKSTQELYNYANKYNIVLPPVKEYIPKANIKMFGITLLKIYYYGSKTKYKLFGFIPFLTMIKN